MGWHLAASWWWAMWRWLRRQYWHQQTHPTFSGSETQLPITNNKYLDFVAREVLKHLKRKLNSNELRTMGKWQTLITVTNGTQNVANHATICITASNVVHMPQSKPPRKNQTLHQPKLGQQTVTNGRHVITNAISESRTRLHNRAREDRERERSRSGLSLSLTDSSLDKDTAFSKDMN